MVISRKIGIVECDININEANEVYFCKDFAKTIKKDGISGVLDAIFIANQRQMMPLSVFVEMTNACNFNCPFCYINEKSAPVKRIPSFDRIRKDFDLLINKGLLYCTFSGGECLTHEAFFEIYEYLKTKGVLVSLFTNGYLLTDEHFKMFKKYKPFNVEVSIYGVDDITYRNTTKTSKIYSQTVYDNILRLKSLGINVVCKTPITNLTEDFYMKIKDWCEEHGIQYYSGIEMLDTYSGEKTSEYRASEGVCDAFKKQRNLEFWNDKEMLEIITTERSCKKAFDCAAGKYDLFINSDYILMPCMKAMNNNHWFFSIAENGMDKAYADFVRKITEHKKQKLIYCQGCKHHRICQECYMTQYDYDDIEKHRFEYCNWLSGFVSKGCIIKTES